MALATMQASAAVPWHENLQAARSASRDSHKPVLAVFTAPWVESDSDVALRTLSHAEPAALVSACFEPVQVDVEAHRELARSLGVTRVPKACILAADGRLLASFDCPAEPAAFVAAAGRALQQAAAVDAAPPTEAVADALTGKPAGATDLGRTADFTAVKPDPAARGSISLLTAKVRHLSNFADGSTSRSEASTASLPHEQAATAPPESSTDPHLPAAPPDWASRQPKATAGAKALPSQQASHRLVIEPGPATSTVSPATSSAAPWLNPRETAPATADAAESSATISDAPAAPPKSAAASFMAALQKPFSIFSRKPPVATSPAAPPAATPPTMPPALPTSPTLAASAQAEAETDTLGSMPLGLEGYCPVTLAQKGAWTEGRAQWGVRHRGRTYLFAGAEQQAAFLANPDRFAPALSGDDPVLAFEAGKSTPGRRTYGVTYQSRTYLFASPETRATFTADPERYVTRVELAEGRAPATGGTRTL